MTYFKNINSLAELKKEYRHLALENHPDKGGSTEMMQQINVEFERLHEIWKNDTTVSANASGYENDYAGATAKEYANFVYNEYRWKGRNYQGQHAPEIVALSSRLSSSMPSTAMMSCSSLYFCSTLCTARAVL